MLKTVQFEVGTYYDAAVLMILEDVKTLNSKLKKEEKLIFCPTKLYDIFSSFKKVVLSDREHESVSVGGRDGIFEIVSENVVRIRKCFLKGGVSKSSNPNDFPLFCYGILVMGKNKFNVLNLVRTVYKETGIKQYRAYCDFLDSLGAQELEKTRPLKS